MNNPFSNKSDKSSQAKAQSQTRGDAFDPELNPNTFEDPEFKPDIEEGNPKHSASSTTNSAKDLEEIAKLARQNSELIGDLQRTRADFENFRKQVELQREQAKTIAKHATIKPSTKPSRPSISLPLIPIQAPYLILNSITPLLWKKAMVIRKLSPKSSSQVIFMKVKSCAPPWFASSTNNSPSITSVML